MPRDSAVAADAEGCNCRGGLTSPSPLLTLNGLSAWQLVLADEYVLEATFHNVLFFHICGRVNINCSHTQKLCSSIQSTWVVDIIN